MSERRNAFSSYRVTEFLVQFERITRREAVTNSIGPILKTGGLILTGGHSTRMGRSKAHLPFGEELMLQRVASLLAQAVDPIVVVGAPGQELPPLPPQVAVAHDEVADRGPLAGLAAGLRALTGRCDSAFATSCDVPLLRPQFVECIVGLLAGHRIAVPLVDEFHHPLSAVYRLDVLDDVDAMLAADRLRPRFLFDAVDTRIVTRDELLGADPELNSLRNCNRPEDYEKALSDAGLA